MPRVTRGRTVEAEANLQGPGGVIAVERAKCGWSYETLAGRMREAGCPIAKSALFKIEAAESPRGVGVAELVAFAAVFDTTVADLLMPPEARRNKRVAELAKSYDDAMMKIAKGAEALLNTFIDALELHADDPEAWESVQHRLTSMDGASPIAIEIRDPFPEELFMGLHEVTDKYTDGLVVLAKAAVMMRKES